MKLMTVEGNSYQLGYRSNRNTLWTDQTPRNRKANVRTLHTEQSTCRLICQTDEIKHIRSHNTRDIKSSFVSFPKASEEPPIVLQSEEKQTAEKKMVF